MGEFDLPPMMPPDGLRPARQASVLLFVLAGLILVPGLMFCMASMVPPDRWPPETQKRFEEVASAAGVTVRQFLLTYAVCATTMGLLLAGLGVLVRTGRRWAVLTGMVVDGILMLLVFVSAVSSFRDSSGLPGFFFACGLGAVMMMLMRRLIAAEKAARFAAAQAAYFYAQQWQAMQQPFEPGSGYGYSGDQAQPPPEETRR